MPAKLVSNLIFPRFGHVRIQSCNQLVYVLDRDLLGRIMLSESLVTRSWRFIEKSQNEPKNLILAPGLYRVRGPESEKSYPESGFWNPESEICYPLSGFRYPVSVSLFAQPALKHGPWRLKVALKRKVEKCRRCMERAEREKGPLLFSPAFLRITLLAP